MKKPTERQPIDELFARKLGNMSLPPRIDGFERLQARMGQGREEARVTIWRNPTMQRYMAAVACLLLVCLFGWLYWSSGTSSTEQQVAGNKIKPHPAQKSDQDQIAQQSGNEADNLKTSAQSTLVIPPRQQLAKVDKPSEVSINKPSLVNQSIKAIKKTSGNAAPTRNEAVLAQVKPVRNKQDASMPTALQPTHQPTTEQLADTKMGTKPAPVVERVLVVTIAEPEALVAARQAAMASTEEKMIVAVTDKSDKASKGNSLWQQVKRIKQGEVLARGDNSDVESSLLGRAYNGLKHSLDKDKSLKQ